MIGVPLSNRQIENLITRADVDGDNEIDYIELTSHRVNYKLDTMGQIFDNVAKLSEMTQTAAGKEAFGHIEIGTVLYYYVRA